MAQDEPTYMTQAELLERVRNDRDALAKIWQGLTDEQMVRRPGPQEGWSVKDVIAHITYWEGNMLARVTELIDGESWRSLEGHIDTLNAQVYEQGRDRPLAEVLEEFAANLPRLEALITSLSDEQINEKALYPTPDGIALLPILIGDTFGHYGDHVDELRVYVAGLGG